MDSHDLRHRNGGDRTLFDQFADDDGHKPGGSTSDCLADRIGRQAAEQLLSVLELPRPLLHLTDRSTEFRSTPSNA
jgi:hypothetical protein